MKLTYGAPEVENRNKQLILDYCESDLSVNQLADKYCLSRQRIYQILHRAGILTRQETHQLWTEGIHPGKVVISDVAETEACR